MKQDKIKLFLEKVENNKWCFNPMTRERIKELLEECGLLENGNQ